MRIYINDQERQVDVSGNPTLLDVLREQLDLTGTKYGCGEGACGACKVLINGVPSPACITPAVSVQGKKVTTIEGLEKNGRLHPVQEAFIEEDVFQCGYCAPGMIITAAALIENNPNLSKQEIQDAMHGNICRCCTYPDISKAIAKAAEK